MRWIVGVSLKFGVLMVALAAGVIFVGVTQLRSMPVDVLPEFTPPYVEVQTEALGLSAEEVEQLITVPLEQDLLNGVPWLAEIRSESLPGLSSVVMTFDRGTDPLRARQVVGERLTQAFALPHVSRPPTMLQPISASSRVMMVGLSSTDLPLIDLSVLARWTIAPRLMGVPGVANVSIWGQRDRQLQVQVDPERLRDQDITLLQVLETTGNAMWVSSLSFVEASTPGTGGFIETNYQRLGIRHVFPISSPEGLAQVPVEGVPSLSLGDVANVVEDHQPLIGDAVTNGPSLILVVEKSPSANTLEVTRGLDKALTDMRPGLTGVEINPSLYRPASFIEMAIGNVTGALLVGGLLILLVLGAFLFDWRAGLISAIAIPVSLTAGALVLYFRGASVNTMVVAGFLIAVALVIDDAILDVDRVVRRFRYRESATSTQSTLALIVENALEVRSAALYAALILALVVAPVWLIGGLSGAFLQPMVIAYGLAVLASMLVALLLTPALTFLLLGQAPLARREPPLVAWLQRAYGQALRPLVRTPGIAFVGLAVMAIAGLATIPFIRQSLVPSFREPDLLIQFDGAPGTSQPEMNRIVSRVGEELQTIPGVGNVGAHIGRAVLSDRNVDVNASEVWVNIEPAARYDDTVAAVRRVIDGYPGLRRSVHTYLQDRSASVAGVANPLTVRVFGENPAVLSRTAEDVQRALTGIEGLDRQHVDLPVRQPTLEVAVDLAKAQHYGLKPGDIRRTAATLLSGIQAGSLFEDQKVFDVVVWGTPATRNSLSSIRDLLLDTPGGDHVRLSDVADVRIVPALSVIRHQDVRSYVDIRADVRGRAVEAVAADVDARLHAMQFPLEYHAEVLGDYAVQQAGTSRALGVGAAAVLGIFLVLQAAFGSWRLAAFAMVLLPTALVGGLAAVMVGGGALTLGGAAGLLAVFGIATRHCISLVRHYQYMQSEGESFGPELILRGARERLGPVLITTIATSLAVLPFLAGGDGAGFELARPMAVVVLCSLTTTLIANLFVLPAACSLLASRVVTPEASGVATAPAPLAVASGMAGAAD
jgi:Cu/Ag efflux pump CusA